MSPDSCFIRVGSSIESMNEEKILNLFSKRVRNSLKNITSPIKDLDFKTLKIYYQESGYEINENFLNKLDLYTDNKEFNYIAYLRLLGNLKKGLKFIWTFIWTFIVTFIVTFIWT